MTVLQLSVFLENKSGRLTDVLEVLGIENMEITALSVADTSEFGILRLIVPEPEKARELLKKHGFVVSITEVISIKVPNKARNYAKVLKILSDLDISVEYTYAYSFSGKSIIILQCTNTSAAIKALKEHDEIGSGEVFKH